MNKYLKSFLHRGLIFGGFGPIVCSIVFIVISRIEEGFMLNGTEIFTAVVSTYLLAFIQAGASIFNQIEEWSTAKSLFYHLGSLYAAYCSCYLLNSWIPFDIKVIMIFTVIFAVIYFAVWTIVFVSIKATSKKFNEKLK